jgi:hypothetical protein
VIRENAVRDSKFVDRGFVLVVLLAIVGLFAGLAFSLVDQQPRQSSFMLFLHNAR